MWTFKQKISILLLLLLLVLLFSGALAPLGTVEASSNLGGWSAIGSSLDGYYFSVDDLGFRIHFNLEDGYLLSVRYLEFDDYGTCVADETYYGSWDVTQAGDVIITCDALGVYGEPFVILGDTAYFNLPSDEGIISLEFVSWGSMDQEQGSDTVAPDPERILCPIPCLILLQQILLLRRILRPRTILKLIPRRPPNLHRIMGRQRKRRQIHLRISSPMRENQGLSMQRAL